MSSTLEYRKNRINQACTVWKMEKVNPFFARKKISDHDWFNLRESIQKYIAKALHFDFILDEREFISKVDASRGDRQNITPNGAVVPKREYALEYNMYIRSWCEIVKNLISDNPGYLKKFRLTPNIRIKFGQELEDNIGRGLNTAYPHSDAWVEGPWGMNCHLPILGDNERNYLHFFKLKDEKMFSDDFLKTSPDYEQMQWVLEFYEDDVIKPERGFVNLSDYSLIHQTMRKPNAGTRISIDTTIFIGDHDVHPDRESEYLDVIPNIGEDLFIACEQSEKLQFKEKNSAYSHYTSGTLRHIRI